MKPTCGHTHPDGPRSAGWAGSALFRPPAFGAQHPGLTGHPPHGPQTNRATGQLGCLDTLGPRALDLHPAGPQALSPSQPSTPGYRWPLTMPSCPRAFRPTILPTPPSHPTLRFPPPALRALFCIRGAICSRPRPLVLPWTPPHSRAAKWCCLGPSAGRAPCPWRLPHPSSRPFSRRPFSWGPQLALGSRGQNGSHRPCCLAAGRGRVRCGVRGTALQGMLRTEDTEPGALLHTRDFIWTVSAAPTLGPSQAEPVGNAAAPGVPALSPLLLLQELVLDVLVAGAAIRALLFLRKQIGEREGLSVRLRKRRAVQLRAAAPDAAPVPGASTQGTGGGDPPAPSPQHGHAACMSGAMSLLGTRAWPLAAGSPLPAGSHGSGQCPFSSALSLYGVVSAAAGASLKAAQQSAHSRRGGSAGGPGGRREAQAHTARITSGAALKLSIQNTYRPLPTLKTPLLLARSLANKTHITYKEMYICSSL